MKVFLHRLYKCGNDAAADRIRYAGIMAFRYWVQRAPKIGLAAAASLVACELQVIVEGHNPKTVSADWK